MIKCGEDCTPSCKLCRYVYIVGYYIDEVNVIEECICAKGNEEVHSKGYCEEFHCLNAERNDIINEK